MTIVSLWIGLTVPSLIRASEEQLRMEKRVLAYEKLQQRAYTEEGTGVVCEGDICLPRL